MVCGGTYPIGKLLIEDTVGEVVGEVVAEDVAEKDVGVVAADDNVEEMEVGVETVDERGDVYSEGVVQAADEVTEVVKKAFEEAEAGVSAGVSGELDTIGEI